LSHPNSRDAEVGLEGLLTQVNEPHRTTVRAEFLSIASTRHRARTVRQRERDRPRSFEPAVDARLLTWVSDDGGG
jgi:hypothetical protein